MLLFIYYIYVFSIVLGYYVYVFEFMWRYHKGNIFLFPEIYIL